MKILIVGAGLIGVSCAYHLSKDKNHGITVIDRQHGVGLETSFANGGQISVSHAEPWANPSAPLKVLSWLFQDDAPLLFRPKFDPYQWAWCLQFLKECLPHNTDRNIADIVRLGAYSRAQLQKIRKEENLNYEQKTSGILHFYTDQKEYESALHPTELMRKLGCDRRLVSQDECYAIESALRYNDNIVGGTYTAEDESGDAFKFTQELTKIAKANGVKFKFNEKINRLSSDFVDHGFLSTENTETGEHTPHHFDAVIFAAGSYTAPMLRDIGINLPIYPAKGYSATFDIPEEALNGICIAPTVSLTDDEKKIVISRLGNRLRIAGTAELNGYDTTLNKVRCDALINRTEELFPELMKHVDKTKIDFWTGLRPATPSNVPIIGKTKSHSNVFIASGHGTLGWTEAAGTGKIIADTINKKELEISWNTNLKV